MTRPIQIRTASQREVAAFVAHQRDEEGKAALARAARDCEWQDDFDDEDLECEAWEQAAAQLLDEGREIFGSEAAAQMEFDRIVKRRAKASAQQNLSGGRSWTPSPFEESRAFFLALRQGVPLILLLIFVGLPVATLIGTVSAVPLMAAIAGIVWYVHSRMLENIREMRPADDD
ncbi:hypothetical protein MU516_16760 [Paracoccus sp. YLB-12]|jgi:hypothetical protein|uniref:Uncharacterized protein n=1 Tax=Paracoccus maritimus TaxID=2933292 RepID=A0ABT2KDA1_9RHOB|nr:hypothetical protein [Paracoccus sp. YLB-12]MCT4334508.1 hypothetical protein [Paracoccus sp. YLB-12]